MANKVYDKEINKHSDWGGDDSTENLPVSGSRVQEFIKKTLDGKMGVFYYDTTNNRYLVFADIENRDLYLEDPTKNELVLGTFDAPFNYEAEINLISGSYKAVQLGSTGNYVEFIFDTKNKQGASVGGLATVTYTIIRNSTKKVITETRNSRSTVRFNLDKYLGEGTNTIIIGITDKNTLAATTVSVTYQVVNLTIKDELNISKVYDLSSATSLNMEVLFNISGYGTKTVEWYIDGEQLEFVKEEDEVVDVEASRTKYITLSNLQQGRHSLQLRAHSIVNGEKFYTNTLYRDFIVYTGASTDTILGIAIEIPSENGIIGPSDNVSIYNMEQYVPYSLRFASYSPTNEQGIEVGIYLNDELNGAITSSNDTENNYTLVSSKSGNKVLKLVSGKVEYTIPVVVTPTSMNISDITNNLELDFTAVGKSNSSPNRDNWTYNGYTGTFYGFKWNDVSGWVNNRLLMPSGTSFSIDYAPLDNNPTGTGKTIELEFSTLNVRDDDAVICDLRNASGTGLLITATRVSLTSENGVTVETEFRSGENVRIAFVINKSSGTLNKCLSFIYTNGIISRGEAWSATDKYDSPKTIKFTASDKVEVSLKAIRIYNTALTSDQILNNYILYRDSIEEMTSVYEKNDVYTEGTTSFDPNKMMSRVPVMIVTGDIPVLENTSDKKTQIIVDIDYYNMQDPTRNFSMVSAAMRPQGTSSMGYPKKNFRIYTQKVDGTILYDSNGKVVQDKLYSFREGSQPVNCWCLKADYAESSGTHNTGIAKLWNKALYNVQIDGEYVCRTNAQKAAIVADYEYDVRTAIDGFPILLFYRKTKNDDLIFIGKYNFNNDKSTESVFGFKGIPGFDNSRMQCWEVLNNGNSLALFTTSENFDTKWEDAFESRYPDTSNPDISDLKTFVEWMSTVSQENFATEKWEHMDIYKLAAYYVYILRHAAVDQTVKNAMFTSEDGSHFYYIHYDNDTVHGLINTGRLRVKPTDDRQSTDDSGAYLFAGHDSRLWNMLEGDKEFMGIVQKMDNALYSAGISYINIIDMLDGEQADKWVERVYNQDAQYKYIGPYAEKGIDNLFMLQGKRDLHRKWWLAKRFSIYDAKFITGPYKSQSIEFKCINGTPAGQQFTIVSGYPINFGYGINDEPRETGIYLDKDGEHTFTTTEVLNVGDPIRIYGAPNIKILDTRKMADKLATISIAAVYDDNLGTCLTHLRLGSSSLINNEVTAISGLKQAKRLEFIDIRSFKKLTSLDLSEHQYIKSVWASNSGIASLLLAKGSPVQVLKLPATITNLTLEQLSLLAYSAITFDDIKTLKNINIKDCPLVSNNFGFIYNWFNSKTSDSSECSLVMDNIDWTNVDTAQLLSLKALGTLKLKGRIKLVEVSESQLSELQAVFGNNIFNSSSELYIIAPPAVYLVGPESLTEGGTGKYSCVVSGAELQSASFSITSGSSSAITLDSTTGVLTTTEGAGGREITVQLIAKTRKEGETKVTTTTKTMTTRILSKTYPSSGDTTLEGDSQLGAETTYTIKHSNTYTGDFNVTWSLTGLDGYAEIAESSKTSCIIRRLQVINTVISGTLTAKFTKVYNGSALFTLSKSVQLVNDDIAVADAKIAKVFYDAKLCANSTYVTKEEAASITTDDIQPGSTESTSIFKSLASDYKGDFSGFKYFTSVTAIRPHMFADKYFEKLCLPSTITIIKVNAYLFNMTHLEINEGLSEMHLIFAGQYLSLPNITSPVEGDMTLSVGPKGMTVTGGNSLTQAISRRCELVYDAPIDVLSIDSTNIRALYNNETKEIRLVVGGDTELPTTVTAPSGGYFEDMSTSQKAILEEVNTNVYKIANKVYYATVVIDTNMSEQNPDFFVTYTNHNGEKVQTTAKAGTHILPIKYGTTVTVSGQEIENYTCSMNVWHHNNRHLYTGNIKMQYKERTGIYIQHTDGTLYTKDDWKSKGFANEKANGVAVVRPISGSFVIAKEDGPESLWWGGYGTTITGIVTSNSVSTAVLDNDGANNTTKIIEQLTGVTDDQEITGAPAAEYCAGYTFPNGKTGYLGALGEWQAVFDNYYNGLYDAMVLIGNGISFNSYWTSTQVDSGNAWYYSRNYFNGRPGAKSYREYTGNAVRAFCPLS